MQNTRMSFLFLSHGNFIARRTTHQCSQHADNVSPLNKGMAFGAGCHLEPIALRERLFLEHRFSPALEVRHGG
jgi:hypothetical protein